MQFTEVKVINFHIVDIEINEGIFIVCSCELNSQPFFSNADL